MDILTEAKQLEPRLREDRRTLHQNPEVGFALEDTKAYVRRRLEQMGISCTDCGRAGLVALVGGKQGGKTFLLRADMDALPLPEEAEEPFASSNGAMHACGHDMHTAMLLGAACILKNHENELKGTVKLMFQPAEEILEGCRDMIEAGVLENPKPDAAMMIHVTAAMPMEAGTIIVCAPGVSSPAADYFNIRVQGKGCHGSTPWNGVDALTAASHILIALQELHARELPSYTDAVLTIGTFRGGTASNVIADSAELGGTIRVYDEESRTFLKERMAQIASSIATAYRAEASVEFGSGCPTLVNDGPLAKAVTGYLREILPTQVLSAADFGSASKSGGSEDFAYVSHQIPSVMLALAAGAPEKGYAFPQHHPRVRFDESVLPIGAAAYTLAAMLWLGQN